MKNFIKRLFEWFKDFIGNKERPKPLPTITPTVTNTPIPTPTVTPSVTNTPTSSLTPSLTNTPTPLPTNTPTPSVTVTITNSITPTPTNTITPTNTETPTPTPSVTNTPTPSLTPTPTNSSSNKIILIEDWKIFVEGKSEIIMLDGYTYLVPSYKRAEVRNDLIITCNGKAEIIFGKDYYNQWLEKTEDRFIFQLGRWNNHIKVENVDLFTAKLIDEVQPFYRTLFWNTPEKDQTGTIELINSNTNIEYGLLYSGSQHEYLTCKAININFEGIMFQELKANNGGGLLSYQRNCNLKQIDPTTSYQSKLKLLDQNTIISSVPFISIQNIFIESGNSCNIVFFGDMTFYLPKSDELGNIKTLRTIPKAGDIIELTWSELIYNNRYLGSNQYELQAGDIVEFDGIQYNITAKDRTIYPRFINLGYMIDYAVDKQLPVNEGNYFVKVIKSKGYESINKEFDGYIIFKYNENFQTNINIDHGLDYMLKSNPFGVLSYNHKEITVDWEDNIHDGYYRQSRSYVGNTNGYRLVNCVGYKDQFNPSIEIIKI